MNIIEIINRMNSGGVIDADELEYFETHYDAGTMPAIDPSCVIFSILSRRSHAGR